MKIHKYVLGGIQNSFKMNDDSQILHVEAQNGDICVWATHCDGRDLVDRWFFVVGTGHEFEFSGCAHIGTVLVENGALVFHVFEKFKQ